MPGCSESPTHLRDDVAAIVAANAKDMEAGVQSGLSAAMLDRLKLTPDRIESLAKAVEHIISLPDPVGEVIEGQRRPNGLFVSRVRVPLGVVFFIYESRPNVTIDAAALVREERQCGDSSRRQRSDSQQSSSAVGDRRRH